MHYRWWSRMAHLDYKLIFWLVVGSLVVPLYLVACVLSIIKAYSDRKAIKARNEARRLQLPPPGPPSPVEIIAQEVRKNKWHRRQSSMAVSRLESLLRINQTNNCTTRPLGAGAVHTSGRGGCQTTRAQAGTVTRSGRKDNLIRMDHPPGTGPE